MSSPSNLIDLHKDRKRKVTQNAKEIINKTTDNGDSQSSNSSTQNQDDSEPIVQNLDSIKEELVNLYKECCNSRIKDPKLFKRFVDILYQKLIHCETKEGETVDIVRAKNSTSDPFSCSMCLGVLYEPVTLICGHTYCQSCYNKESVSSDSRCVKCNHSFNRSSRSKTFHNVNISNVTSQLWSDEIESVKLRIKANSIYENGNVHQAIETLNKSISIYSKDPIAWNNRSSMYLTIGNYKQSLADACKAIEIQPTLAKSYFRKAFALKSQHKYFEAFTAMCQCILLEKEENHKYIRNHIQLCLYQNFLNYQHKDEINFQEISQLIETIFKNIADIFDNLEKPIQPRNINANLIKVDDFECPLCFRLFLKPVTTPCGHSFCRACLDRTLDHTIYCPMCKHGIAQYLVERRDSPDEFINELISKVYPIETQERQLANERELDDFCQSTSENAQIPIFVCTMSFPNVPCPLHIYEPRYRLMIRRCMESGTREFGMCIQGADGVPFSEYGTMLEIRDIQYLPDGRSVIDTIGRKRFKVIQRGLKDGYNTAQVKYLEDVKVMAGEIDELKRLHDRVEGEAKSWLQSLSSEKRREIQNACKDFPSVESNYWELPNGPSWCWWLIHIFPLRQDVKAQLLSTVSLIARLKGIRKTLVYLLRHPS